MLPLRLLLFLLAGGVLLSVPGRAQCTDCFVPSVNPRVEEAATRSGPSEQRPRAQAGDVTAVAVEVSDRGGGWGPLTTINTPTAFGLGWGQLYAGMTYQHRIRYSRWRDGIVAGGVGLGNPTRTVGVTVAGSLLDTYTDFGRDRSLSLKVHRRLPFRTAVAVGVENLWHTEGTDGGRSRYGVVSAVLPLRTDLEGPFGAVVLSGGVGDDRFLSEPRFARGEQGVGVFGSLGVRLLGSVNGIVNWSGQDLNLGLSLARGRRWPVVITPALLDVGGHAGDGARPAVSASVGYDARR